MHAFMSLGIVRQVVLRVCRDRLCRPLEGAEPEVVSTVVVRDQLALRVGVGYGIRAAAKQRAKRRK